MYLGLDLETILTVWLPPSFVKLREVGETLNSYSVVVVVVAPDWVIVTSLEFTPPYVPLTRTLLGDVDELLEAVTVDPEIENPVTDDTIEKLVTVWFPEFKDCVLPELQVLVPVLDAVPDSVDVPPEALIVVGLALQDTDQEPQESE